MLKITQKKRKLKILNLKYWFPSSTRQIWLAGWYCFISKITKHKQYIQGTYSNQRGVYWREFGKRYFCLKNQNTDNCYREIAKHAVRFSHAINSQLRMAGKDKDILCNFSTRQTTGVEVQYCTDLKTKSKFWNFVTIVWNDPVNNCIQIGANMSIVLV